MDVGDESCAKDRLETDGEARDRSVGAGEAPAGDVGELARLRSRERQLQAVAELGFAAIGAPPFGVLLERAVQSVAQALEAEIVALEELQADGDLLVHAAVGVVDDALGRQPGGAGEGSQAGYTLRAGTPVITNDLLGEARFRPAAVLTRSAARSSLSVAVGSRERPWGVLLAASSRERRFSEDDVGFLQGVANVLAIARERGESQSRLRSILDHAPAVIYLIDLDGRFVVINDELEKILGVPREQALGKLREEVLPADAAAQHRANDLEVLRDGASITFEETALRPDGEHVYRSVKFPLRDPEGRIYGVGGISTDVTDQRIAERERERALADLEEAQRLARVGSWSWNPETEIVSWSAQMYAIFGRDPAHGPPSLGEFIAYAHPDDRERVADAYAQARGGQAAFELECRIVTAAGVQRIAHVLAHQDLSRPGSYLGTVQDVTRQRRAERERLELLQASERAESANRAKSEFLARMSHELRTPLNSIIGFSQVLQLERLDPRHNQDIGHILTAGNHLLALVNEVLDLARIESGQITLSPEPVALANTVHDALALLAPIARERHVSLGIDTDGLADDGHVHADRNRLKQVLLNVLSNAIKYNRPGGRVDVSFQLAEGARVRTMIADTGIGIGAAHLDKLFEPFERLGAEQTDVDGTGLGLALSKGLIEAMGGTIEVQSAVGVGTTFVIELAAAQRPAGARQPSPGDQALAELGGPDAKPQLVLYIEDNLSNLTLVERILERRVSVELISAMQGTLGLELARQHHPDLIVLDLHLPDMPGTEVLTRLKTDPITREIPVIVLTADASGRQSERVRQLGAIDYLTKPLDVPKFIEIIANNLADH